MADWLPARSAYEADDSSAKRLVKDETKFSRKTTLIVTHTEADKGKPAYYAACYENSKGDQGTWSPVEEAFIT